MVHRKGSYREADVSFGLFEVLCYWTSACMTRDILPVLFFFIKAASIPSPSAIRRISRGIGISLILANSGIFFDKVLYPDFAKSIFIGGDLSASCLSSWQIKHFDQFVLCFSWADKESRILFDIVTNNQKQKYEKQIDKNNWIKK